MSRNLCGVALPVTKCQDLKAGNLASRPFTLGRHPFNVEPSPEALMARGFITPVSLHYVRNHGPVPRVAWDTHKLNIGESYPISIRTLSIPFIELLNIRMAHAAYSPW